MNAMTPTPRFPKTVSPTQPQPVETRPQTASARLNAATVLLQLMETGQPIDTPCLRSAMTEAYHGTDAEGAWDWKTAYDVCEIASVLFLRKYGGALKRLTQPPAAFLPTLHKIAALLPTQTRRSVDSQTYQQFSTPLPLGWVAAAGAMIGASDTVLEPSAGTGLMAILAEMLGANLLLNELEPGRADTLLCLYPKVPCSRHDAAQIDDHLAPSLKPSVVLMNPPFSVLPGVTGTVRGAAMKHIRSAFARLAEGGRLVAITGSNLSPDAPEWRQAFIDLQASGRLVFSAAIDGRVYARHGTTVDTRLTIIDKIPATHPQDLLACQGVASDVETLMAWVSRLVPPRAAMTALRKDGRGTDVPAAPSLAPPGRPSAPSARPLEAPGAPVAYETHDWAPETSARLSEAVYEPYRLQTIRIPGAKPHPTTLVQSAAMSSVAPPKPAYQPLLPAGVVDGGLLSDAQLESVIYAGEAHSAHLAGWWTIDDTYDLVSAAAEGGEGACQFRRGWFLGDGTGAGKGRQSAAIILDNWLQGRRRALWISKSDKLLEDAQRDWRALGRERLEVTPLSRFKPGAPIVLDEAVLFTTYATLRSEERGSKKSRIQQIVDWLGRDFDGVIIFDEAHAMQNAAGGTSE
ncbi:MAG TPA: strawberry notch family protein, partial [Asticcacaulis sp.]|nr:strawberry notch family protein [Asticcacaulis sp.]